MTEETDIQSSPNQNPDQPLTEASPKSLDLLFNMDPLNYTSQDIEDVVRAFREKSAIWKIEEANGKKKSSADKSIPAPDGFSLADLDFT